MKAKMKTQRAKELYALRSQTVEPVFDDIKENKGLRGFLMRGIESVKTEFNLVCIARNLRKIKDFLKENRRTIPFMRRFKQEYVSNIAIELDLQRCAVR